MNVHLLYFGMIAEVTGKQKEAVTLDENARVADLRQWLLETHDGLQDKEFRIAMDLEVVGNEDTPLKEGSELALLPAFAGG